MSLSRLFIRRIIREMNEEKHEGLHVSNFVTLTICPRLFWFDKKHHFPPDIDSLLKMWQGRKLHDIRLGDIHELEIEYDGVKGRIDDYISFLGVLIDKKFVSFLPKDDKETEKYYGHYITQLKLYSYMLTVNGLPVKEARLLFIDLSEKQPFKEYVFEPDLPECEKLFYKLKRKAEEILASEKPPEIPAEFSPPDSLIQRAGRVARKGGSGKVLMYPLSEGGKSVYAEELVKKTLRKLSGMRVVYLTTRGL